MTSIHPKAKLCFVSDDGDGGAVVKMTGPDGGILEFELDAKRAATLVRDLAQFLARRVV